VRVAFEKCSANGANIATFPFPGKWLHIFLFFSVLTVFFPCRTQSVTLATRLQNMATMRESVQNRSRQSCTSQDFRPLLERQVRRYNHTCNRTLRPLRHSMSIWNRSAAPSLTRLLRVKKKPLVNSLTKRNCFFFHFLKWSSRHGVRNYAGQTRFLLSGSIAMTTPFALHFSNATRTRPQVR